jgi:histidyl-tRNA synthetase
MRDILPQKMIRREYVIGVIRQVFEEFGFEPLQTPAIELQEILTGKYGPDAERMMYSAVIYEILTRLGFEEFVMNVNDRKLLNGIGLYAGVPDEKLGGLYRSIDKLDRIGLEGVEAELRKKNIPEDAVQRLLDLLQIEGTNQEILAELQVLLAGYPEALEGIAELEEIVGYLEALGIPERTYQIVPSMVRGLEYYTGPIYETVVEKPKIGSITGGGRFDNLVGMFMDRSFPATGATIGIERIIAVMEELDMFPPEVGATVAQVLVTRFSSDLVKESLSVARDLRKAGLNAEMYFEDDSLGDQIRYALKKGIPYVAILGPDEVEAGQVAIRILERKQQETLPREEVADRIRALQQS